MTRHVGERPYSTPRWKVLLTDFISAVAYTWMVACAFILGLTMIFWIFDL